MLSYLKRRLDERSTWLLFSAAITSAAALAWPWSLVSCSIGIVAALVPDGSMNPAGGE